MMSEKQTSGGEYILWDSMQEVISEIVYGGRVTDEVDRRTLKTILRIYISNEVMDEGYMYYGSCYSPLGRSGCDLEIIKGEIMGMPDIDQPEIFGMTQIADMNFSI
jgi:dynein heavy chain, axonemal